MPDNNDSNSDDDSRFWEQYQKLPPELQDAVFDEKTADCVRRACQRTGQDSLIDFIIDKVGDTYLGNLPPEQLFTLIKEKISDHPDAAQKIIDQINEVLLMPLEQSLAKLYGKAVPPVNSPSPAEPAGSALSPVPGAAAKPTVINQPPSTSAAQMPTANNPLKQAAPIMPPSNPRIAPIPTKPQPLPSSPTVRQTPAEPPSTSTLSASPGGFHKKVF